jgi:glutathione S-transferase
VTRANNPKQDHSKLEASARKAIQNLENIWLKDGPFIGGLSKPSIADISAYGEVIELIITVPGYSNVNDHPFIAPFEKVKAWTKRMKQLEHYEEVHKYLYTLAARQRSKL